MIAQLTLIFLCQLLGELIVGAFALPVPGPVVGMVLLFLLLMAKARVPDDLGTVAGTLQSSMSLLFVPAGAGVMLHFGLLGEALAPLAGAILVSTVATIAVTGAAMRWLSREGADD